MQVAQVEKLVRVERPGCRHHLSCAAQDVGRHVEARAVRHRGPVDQAGILVGGVEVGQVRQRHRQQVAMGQHRALRATRGPAGVEQPGQVRRIGDAGDGCHLCGATLLVLDRPDGLHRCRRGTRQRDADLRRREHLCGAGIVEDLAHLTWMQLVVERDEHTLGRPDREHQLHDLWAVLAGHRDPGTRSELLQ